MGHSQVEVIGANGTEWYADFIGHKYTVAIEARDRYTVVVRNPEQVVFDVALFNCNHCGVHNSVCQVQDEPMICRDCKQVMDMPADAVHQERKFTRHYTVRKEHARLIVNKRDEKLVPAQQLLDKYGKHPGFSIRQPWAWLVATGQKDVENRRYSTGFRGWFYVHASKTFDHDGYDYVVNEMGIELPPKGDFKLGGIIGLAQVVNVTRESDSKWFFGPNGYLLEGAREIEFTPCRGKISPPFFQVTI